MNIQYRTHEAASLLKEVPSEDAMQRSLYSLTIEH